VKGRTLTVRAVVLLAAGSAGIHQARYAIGYGSDASRQLAAHGHGYLTPTLPLVVAALVLVMAAVLLRIARGGTPHASRPLWALWLAASAALALIFTVQESIEGASVIAGSGWIGPALAIPAGLLIALALRGAAAAETACPAPRIGFAVFLDSPAPAAAPVSWGRLTPFSVGARAPPLPSVV